MIKEDTKSALKQISNFHQSPKIEIENCFTCWFAGLEPISQSTAVPKPETPRKISTVNNHQI